MRHALLVVLLVSVASFVSGCRTSLPVSEPLDAPTVALAARSPFVLCSAEAEAVCGALHHERAHEEAEEEEKNAVGVFLGWTFESEADGASIGLDYERRVGGPWGVTIFGEYNFGDLREGVVGAGVTYHATERFHFILGAGLDFRGEEESLGLVRFGAAYEVPIGCGFEVGPGVYLDYLWEEREVVVIVGMNLVKQF